MWGIVGMNKKFLVFVPIILAYIILFGLFITMLVGIGQTYKNLEISKVETAQSKISEVLNEKADQIQMNAKLGTIVEELSMELIVTDTKNKTIFTTFPDVEITNIRNLFNNDAFIYKSQGTMNTINGDLNVMLAVYHASFVEYLNTQFIWLTIYITIMFLLLIFIVNLVNRTLFVPLKNIRQAIRDMKNFEFPEIDENTAIDTEFNEMVHRFDKTLRDVSKQYTDLELLLLFEKYRLDFLLKIARGSLHELKTPLYQILLKNKKFLMEHDITEEAMEYNIMQTDALLRRINELLHSILQNVNNLENTKEYFDGVDLYYEIEKDFETLLAQKNIDLSFSSTEHTMLYHNRFAIELIFHNVLSNALKYALDESEVEVEFNVENDEVEILCSNMASEEDIQQLVSDRVTINVSNKMYGSGNGVHLVKELTAYLGGKVVIDVVDTKVMVAVTIPYTK